MGELVDRRPAALVTGVGRRVGIGATVAEALRDDGWTVVTAGWRPYDRRMPWGADAEAIADLECDLADTDEAAALVGRAVERVGPLHGLVMCHAESVDSSILDTTIESFDRHLAVNARATWLLVAAFARQFPESATGGRIVAFTSDHTPFNLPYGASKGALDRIVRAAAVELADRSITANVINPGANDTGWMTPEVVEAVLADNLQPRLGTPNDAANLVRFLLGDEGGWINGQLLYSDGGRRSTPS